MCIFRQLTCSCCRTVPSHPPILFPGLIHSGLYGSANERTHSPRTQDMGNLLFFFFCSFLVFCCFAGHSIIYLLKVGLLVVGPWSFCCLVGRLYCVTNEFGSKVVQIIKKKEKKEQHTSNQELGKHQSSFQGFVSPLAHLFQMTFNW